MPEMSYEDWWELCLEVAPTARIKLLMEREYNRYYSLWLSGATPEDAYYN